MPLYDATAWLDWEELNPDGSEMVPVTEVMSENPLLTSVTARTDAPSPGATSTFESEVPAGGAVVLSVQNASRNTGPLRLAFTMSASLCAKAASGANNMAAITIGARYFLLLLLLNC